MRKIDYQFGILNFRWEEGMKQRYWTDNYVLRNDMYTTDAVGFTGPGQIV